MEIGTQRGEIEPIHQRQRYMNDTDVSVTEWPKKESKGKGVSFRQDAGKKLARRGAQIQRIECTVGARAELSQEN